MMFRRIVELLLLAGLLAGFAAASAPAFAARHCTCYTVIGDRVLPGFGGCKWDARANQCVSMSCNGFCQ
jgi:hypothetical protein